MSSVTRTAGINGTWDHTVHGAVPTSEPRYTIYSDSARTVVAVAEQTMTATLNPAVFTAAYPDSLAAGTYYLGIIIPLSGGDFTDNNDTLILVAVSSDPSAQPLCSLDDFETWLGETISDTDRATLALQIASTAVRSYTGQHLSERTMAETLDGNGRYQQLLFLAERPVTAVATVVEDGTTLTEGNDEDYVWYSDGRLYRVDGWWPRLRQSVVVTYTAGYSSMPADICDVVFKLAQRVLDELGNVKQESIGSYSITYALNPTAGLTADEKHALDSPYRMPVVA